MTLTEAVVSEDIELVASIQMKLPEMNRLGELLLKKTSEWLEVIRQKDKKALVKKMMLLKSRLVKADPQYFRAYERMYKMPEKCSKMRKNNN